MYSFFMEYLFSSLIDKTVENNNNMINFRGTVWISKFRGAAKKRLIYYYWKYNRHGNEYFSVFYSSSQALSNDIAFKMRFKRNR